MLCVALLDSAMKHEGVPMRVTLGIVLTGVALELRLAAVRQLLGESVAIC